MATEVKDGIYPAMITPYTLNYEIDYGAVDQIVNWYAKNRVDGIFAACQSSEIFYLTLRERVKLVNEVVKAAPASVDIVASGHTANTIPEQIEELKAMADTGVKAVVLITNRLAAPDESDDILLAHTETLINALPDVQFGLYECPYPYKRLLSPQVLHTLAATGRFTFFKETSCNTQIIAEKVKAVSGTRLKVFNANSATLLETLRMGVSGFCGIM